MAVNQHEFSSLKSSRGLAGAEDVEIIPKRVPSEDGGVAAAALCKALETPFRTAQAVKKDLAWGKSRH